jgi:tetratricopeptide (TPR) repeat protein
VTRSLPLVLTLLGASTGCPRGDAAPQADAKPSSVEPPATETRAPAPVAAAPEVKPGAEKPKASASEIAAQRKRMLAALNEGRALVKKGEHAAGIAKYREVLAIDGSDPTALAELGWAAFLANDLELAASATEHALQFSRADKQRGMLLYNLGRVFEARGDTEGARERYARSLAARPNKTVQARLEAIEAAAKGMTAAPAGPRSLAVLTKGLPSLTAVCDHLLTKECASHRMFEDEPCSCDPKLGTESTDGTWGLVSMLTSPMGGSEALFPVSKEAGGWTLLDAAVETYNPGAFGIWEELATPEAEMADVLIGGTEEWLLTFNKSRSDRDMGINEIEEEQWRTRVVCTRDLGTTACTRPLVETYHYARDSEFEDEDVAEDEPIEHTDDLPIESHYRTELRFSGGHVEVGAVDASKGVEVTGEETVSPLRLPAGRHDLRAMLLPTP